MRVVSRSKGLILFLLPKRERGKRKKKEKNKRNLLFPLSPFFLPVAFNYDPQFPLSPRLIKFDQEEFREIVRPRDKKKSHDRTNSRESEASIAGSRGRARRKSCPCRVSSGDALITPVITFLTHAYLQLVVRKIGGVGETLIGEETVMRRRLAP